MTLPRNFEEYRQQYSSLSFNDLKMLNLTWYHIFPEQLHFRQEFFCNAVRTASEELKKPLLDIVEIGGYQGELAQAVSCSVGCKSWLNIEIIQHNPMQGLPQTYREHVLTLPLWVERVPLQKYDLLIASETLEHFNDEEVMYLMNYVAEARVKYLAFQIPINEEGQDWKGWTASHVLTMGRKEFRQLLNSNYILIDSFDGVTADNSNLAWFCTWRLRV
jgi:hypothetical protein